MTPWISDWFMNEWMNPEWGMVGEGKREHENACIEEYNYWANSISSPALRHSRTEGEAGSEGEPRPLRHEIHQPTASSLKTGFHRAAKRKQEVYILHQQCKGIVYEMYLHTNYSAKRLGGGIRCGSVQISVLTSINPSVIRKVYSINILDLRMLMKLFWRTQYFIELSNVRINNSYTKLFPWPILVTKTFRERFSRLENTTDSTVYFLQLMKLLLWWSFRQRTL